MEIQTSFPETNAKTATKDKNDVIYSVDEVPPWYLCITLGLQHYLTMFGATLAIPFILAPFFCINEYNYSALGKLIGTLWFSSGLVTLLQSTLGVRLPIVQGGTFSFLTPTISILTLDKWTCPQIPANGTNPYIENGDLWMSRIREIQGAIMIASLLQIVLGATGLIGFLLRFIGPLTIAPSIALIGIALYGAANNFASGHWGIAWVTIALVILFSQYLSFIEIPIPKCGQGTKSMLARLPIFKLFPILFSIIISWALCAILTATDALPDDPKSYIYRARTDAKWDVIESSSWVRVPYPFQWGWPTFSISAIVGMLSGVIAGVVESVGDYYACARLSGAKPPLASAINRGILSEGIGCIIAAILGTGNGTTSYSENIGAIGLTRVGSRRVVQTGALIMIVLGCFVKVGTIFSTIPEPVVGGLFFCMFGMIFSVGISNLQFVDLNSPRNLFIIGFSFFTGFSIPQWMEGNEHRIDTGSTELDQIIVVLLKTSMFLGGVIACILDNTIPGTKQERGMESWNKLIEQNEEGNHSTNVTDTYDLPYVTKYMQRSPCCRYIPFLPQYDKKPTVQSKYDPGQASISYHNTALEPDNISVPM